MTVRDRLVAAVVAALVVVGAFYALVVSPERSKVSNLDSQITTERAALATAQTSLASARRTAAGYVDDVHAISEVMNAIPPRLTEPDFISLIAKLAGGPVNFHELDIGGQAAVSATGPPSLGLTFTFKSSYSALENMLAAIDKLTLTDGHNVSSTGRLVTVSSVTMAPMPPDKESATVTAQIYSQTSIPAGATGSTGPTATTTSSGA